jgi:hypothetical protein
MIMIPQHVLRDTLYAQYLVDEGRQETREKDRELIVEMLLHVISLRYPGCDVSKQIMAIYDLELLKQIFFDLDHLSDEAALRQHLSKLGKTAS